MDGEEGEEEGDDEEEGEEGEEQEEEEKEEQEEEEEGEEEGEEEEEKLGVFQQKMPSTGWATVAAERHAIEVNENCQVTKQHRGQLPTVCPRV